MLAPREILTKARQEGYALGAFNAGNLEILKAIVEAGKLQRQPVIVETSAGEAGHFGIANFLDVVENFREETQLPVLTNLDHGPGLDECQEAITAGYNLVHFDGSKLPYEENVKITQALVLEAHKRGVLVEGEIDAIGGKSARSEEQAEAVQAQYQYTDPVRAADFVNRTGVDILAVFVGNLHGTYATAPQLDLECLRQLAEGLPCFLSLHGGSGIAPEMLREAIRVGRVVKINVNTELRLAFRETLENVLRGNEELAIYKIMPPVIAAVQKVVEEKLAIFQGKIAS